MRGTGGSAETLGVDGKLLNNVGNDLVSSAGNIPAPPAPFATAGTDPISAKIATGLAKLETPIQTGLPELKTSATQIGGKIAAAGGKYDQTDEQLAKQIEQHTFDKSGSPSVGGGLGGAQGVVGFKGGGPVERTGFSTPNHVGGKVGGDAPVSAPPATASAPASVGGGTPGADAPASGAPGSGAAGAGTSSGAPAAGTAAAGAPGAATAASAAGGSAASGAGAMGQMGQMISMPMQMAGQAVGMAAAVPQTVMQGVESAVQQVSQLTGGLGQDGDSSVSDAQLTGEHKGDESRTRPDEPAKAEQAHEGAAADQPHAAEQAPVAPPADQKPPAQTRPAESGPETFV
ncbi:MULTISPECIES: hypothetical protein [unclassified Mycobacterium]|uniref:hypothetical protein n=1 Tax=unclassified Mycobacterium TaxID=2642494 RepID=UPI0029C95767|nr:MULTISPECIES: hypothetical protein [unclassified Mycobacterium]